MEIADIFVVNKSDHLFADEFVKNLRTLVQSKKNSEWSIPVIRTVATGEEGLQALMEKIKAHQTYRQKHHELKIRLLARKAFQLIRAYRMQDIAQEQLEKDIQSLAEKDTFNLYQFCKSYTYPQKKEMD